MSKVVVITDAHVPSRYVHGRTALSKTLVLKWGAL